MGWPFCMLQAETVCSQTLYRQPTPQPAGRGHWHCTPMAGLPSVRLETRGSNRPCVFALAHPSPWLHSPLLVSRHILASSAARKERAGRASSEVCMQGPFPHGTRKMRREARFLPDAGPNSPSSSSCCSSSSRCGHLPYVLMVSARESEAWIIFSFGIRETRLMRTGPFRPDCKGLAISTELLTTSWRTHGLHLPHHHVDIDSCPVIPVKGRLTSPAVLPTIPQWILVLSLKQLEAFVLSAIETEQGHQLLPCLPSCTFRCSRI